MNNETLYRVETSLSIEAEWFRLVFPIKEIGLSPQLSPHFSIVARVGVLLLGRKVKKIRKVTALYAGNLQG